jgi:glutathione S-transferase
LDIQIPDSLAISEFLAESHPEFPLWPKDRVLRALARSVAAEMHSGFQELRSNCPTHFMAKYTGNIPLTDKAKQEAERVLIIWDQARTKTAERLKELGEEDEGYLFGKFGIADSFFWPVLWVCTVRFFPSTLKSTQQMRIGVCRLTLLTAIPFLRPSTGNCYA